MPDLDIISRTVPGPWRKPMRLLRDLGNVPETRREMLKALTETLRRNGGFPGFTSFAATLRAVAEGALDPHSGYTRVEVIQRQHAHHLGVELCGMAAKRLLADLSSHPRLPAGSFESALARAALVETVGHQFLGYLIPRVLGDRCPRPAEVDRLRQELLNDIDGAIGDLARSVVMDPSCSEIRAPRVQGWRRRTTDELLQQSVS